MAEHTHMYPLRIICSPTSDHTPIPSTHHPLIYEWAHWYTLYSSPVNPRVSTAIPSTHHPLTHEWAHYYTLYSSPANPRVSTLLCPLLITRKPTSEHTHIPSTHHPLTHKWAHSYTSTHHPLTHDWAHSYALYSSPVNPRLNTLIYPILNTR